MTFPSLSGAVWVMAPLHKPDSYPATGTVWSQEPSRLCFMWRWIWAGEQCEDSWVLCGRETGGLVTEWPERQDSFRFPRSAYLWWRVEFCNLGFCLRLFSVFPLLGRWMIMDTEYHTSSLGKISLTSMCPANSPARRRWVKATNPGFCGIREECE